MNTATMELNNNTCQIDLGIGGMTCASCVSRVEKALRKYFGKRGDRVVQDNLTCVKRGYGEMKEIPQELIYGN